MDSLAECSPNKYDNKPSPSKNRPSFNDGAITTEKYVSVNLITVYFMQFYH